MTWLLNLVGPLISLINNIFELFKKSSLEKSQDKVSDRMDEIDDQIKDAKKKK